MIDPQQSKWIFLADGTHKESVVAKLDFPFDRLTRQLLLEDWAVDLENYTKWTGKDSRNSTEFPKQPDLDPSG
jgi:hypothetical protein